MEMDYIEVNKSSKPPTNKDFWLDILSNNDELLCVTLGLIAQAIDNNFFEKARRIKSYREDMQKTIEMLYSPIDMNVAEEIKNNLINHKKEGEM